MSDDYPTIAGVELYSENLMTRINDLRTEIAAHELAIRLKRDEIAIIEFIRPKLTSLRGIR